MSTLEELERAATPGPWHLDLENEYGDYGSILSTSLLGLRSGRQRIVSINDDFGQDPLADLTFIAAIRNVTPELLAVVAAARGESGCRVIYGDHPEGFTCLDKMAHAADPANLYSDDYRASILAGERLCGGCRIGFRLADLDAKDGAS